MGRRQVNFYQGVRRNTDTNFKLILGEEQFVEVNCLNKKIISKSEII
jgi:hypothetical protein